MSVMGSGGRKRNTARLARVSRPSWVRARRLKYQKVHGSGAIAKAALLIRADRRKRTGINDGSVHRRIRPSRITMLCDEDFTGSAPARKDVPTNVAQTNSKAVALGHIRRTPGAPDWHTVQPDPYSR